MGTDSRERTIRRGQARKMPVGETTGGYRGPREATKAREAKRQPVGTIVNEIERALSEITPRAAAVTLMLFEQVVTRYERETGRELSTTERAMVVSILRRIVRQDSQPAEND